MKKLLLSAALVFSAFAANAQEIKTDAGTFTKPTTDSVIVEFSFSPNIAGGGIFSLPSLNKDLGVAGIKARKFVSETKAYRAIGNIQVANSGVDGAGTDFTIALGAGIENHLAGAERLSTYYGYEANVGYVATGEDKDPVTNAVINAKTSKIGLGVNAFTGFDYYIMPKVYLGAEISYGVAVTNSKNGSADAITSFELSPGITPSFRLGWMF